MVKLRDWLVVLSFAAGFASYFFTLGIVLWIFFVGPVVLWEESRAIITLEAVWFLISLPFLLRILFRGAMRCFS